MIIPEIRTFDSPDIADLAGHVPADLAEFGFALDMYVGEAGARGQELFEIEVSTPRWLKVHYAGDGLVSGRHRLIVFAYDWPLIEQYLRKRVSVVRAETREEVAAKIGRFARWEFEDYTDPPR